MFAEDSNPKPSTRTSRCWLKNISSCTARLTLRSGTLYNCLLGEYYRGDGIRVNRFTKGRIQTPIRRKRSTLQRRHITAGMTGGFDRQYLVARTHQQPFRHLGAGQSAPCASCNTSYHLCRSPDSRRIAGRWRFAFRTSGLLIKVGPIPRIKQPATPFT